MVVPNITASLFHIRSAKNAAIIKEALKEFPDGEVVSFPLSGLPIPPPLKIQVTSLPEDSSRAELIRQEGLDVLTDRYEFLRSYFEMNIYHQVRVHRAEQVVYFTGVYPPRENGSPVVGFMRLDSDTGPGGEGGVVGALLFFTGPHSPPAEEVWNWFLPALPLG